MRYFDLHCDTASACFKREVEPYDLSLAASTQKGKFFDEWYQCYAVFINDSSENPTGEYTDIITGFKRKFADIKKPVPVYTLENAAPITSLEFIDKLAFDKIRAVTLTWNGENQIAGGAFSDAGLKPFGRQVIECMNKKNIACDLSHLNRKSFFEAADCAKIIFASHSCCDKTHRHPRNLTDGQIKLIANRGGVIGLCFYPEFLGTKYAFEGVWRHIYHLLNMGLENAICIGSDFDGAVMDEELDGVDKLPDLYRFLSSKGASDNTLDKIFFENAKSFFTKF